MPADKSRSPSRASAMPERRLHRLLPSLPLHLPPRIAPRIAPHIAEGPAAGLAVLAILAILGLAAASLCWWLSRESTRDDLVPADFFEFGDAFAAPLPDALPKSRAQSPQEFRAGDRPKKDREVRVHGKGEAQVRGNEEAREEHPDAAKAAEAFAREAARGDAGTPLSAASAAAMMARIEETKLLTQLAREEAGLAKARAERMRAGQELAGLAQESNKALPAPEKHEHAPEKALGKEEKDMRAMIATTPRSTGHQSTRQEGTRQESNGQAPGPNAGLREGPHEGLREAPRFDARNSGVILSIQSVQSSPGREGRLTATARSATGQTVELQLGMRWNGGTISAIRKSGVTITYPDRTVDIYF